MSEHYHALLYEVVIGPPGSKAMGSRCARVSGIYLVYKVGRGNSGHGVIRATSTLQQEKSIHWILASSKL